jgi:hypothetical protein
VYKRQAESDVRADDEEEEDDDEGGMVEDTETSPVVEENKKKKVLDALKDFTKIKVRTTVVEEKRDVDNAKQNLSGVTNVTGDTEKPPERLSKDDQFDFFMGKMSKLFTGSPTMTEQDPTLKKLDTISKSPLPEMPKTQKEISFAKMREEEEDKEEEFQKMLEMHRRKHEEQDEKIRQLKETDPALYQAQDEIAKELGLFSTLDSLGPLN